MSGQFLHKVLITCRRGPHLCPCSPQSKLVERTTGVNGPLTCYRCISPFLEICSKYISYSWIINSWITYNLESRIWSKMKSWINTPMYSCIITGVCKCIRSNSRIHTLNSSCGELVLFILTELLGSQNTVEGGDARLELLLRLYLYCVSVEIRGFRYMWWPLSFANSHTHGMLLRSICTALQRPSTV